MEPISDEHTPLAVLKAAVQRFVEDREWQKFHNPKNLAMSIGIEAGELMEVFQWLTPSDAHRLGANSRRKKQAGDELADVIIYCILLASALGLDISSTVLGKIRDNESKYPAGSYKGEYRRPEDEM
jgi:NTP pyrophosphatase (non-canonical NTP hydrolase)